MSKLMNLREAVIALCDLMDCDPNELVGWGRRTPRIDGKDQEGLEADVDADMEAAILSGEYDPQRILTAPNPYPSKQEDEATENPPIPRRRRGPPGSTERDAEILRMIERRFSASEIGRQLKMSASGVTRAAERMGIELVKNRGGRPRRARSTLSEKA